MNKLFTILMSMFLMITCSDKSVMGPPPEPEAMNTLVLCPVRP